MTTKDRMFRYLGIRHSWYPQFCSNGRDVLFASDMTGMPQVWKVAVPKAGQDLAWPDQLTFRNEVIKALAPSPSPGDGRLIFGVDSGGNENTQLFLLDSDGAGEMPLTEGFEHAVHELGDWSADGSEFLFVSNRREPGLFDLYRMRLGEPAKMVWQNDASGYLVGPHYSPDGRHVVVEFTSSSTSGDLLEIDLQSGRARSLMSTREPARYEGNSYSPDGRSLYLNTDFDSDYMRICRLDLQTLELEVVVEHPWDVQLMASSPCRRYLAYAVNVEGASELYLLNVDTGRTRAAPPFSDAPGVMGFTLGSAHGDEASFSPEGDRLAFGAWSAVRTLDAYVWELSSDVVRPVTRSPHTGLRVSEFITPELVHYPTFDDRQIPAWLLMPAATFPRPVPFLVWAHGGPMGQSRPVLDPLMQAVVANGCGVLSPNVRGSTGYGRAYTLLDDVRLRLDSVADLAYGARWLQQRPDVRPGRIAVGGESYGGFMTLSALTQHPELWAAGVAICGISNLVTFLENTSSYRRAHREQEYGSLAKDREFLQSISPLNHVEKIAAPLLAIHGRNDPRVPVGETEQIVEAVRARGLPCDSIVFDDEGHGVTKLQNQLVAYPAMLEFLEKHLKG